jgi:TPR repeat protein
VETAYNNFLTAQQLGSVEANFYLGALYDWYSYPTQDFAIAKAYYEVCGDNPNAQISLAILYNNGQGVVQDKTKALSMCQSLVNKGYVDAYLGLASIAKDNGDYATAFNYYAKVANEGSEPLYVASAMNSIGYMYNYGQGVSIDYAKAMEWYTKSANLGNNYAMNNIGYMYNHGQGVSIDYAKAMEWYLKVANLGNANAMNNIGAMYEAGEGVSRDYAQAMEWFTKAANLGNAIAMNNIGAMYCNGEGVTKDMSKAVEWWQKAAALGEKNAINNLREAGY